MERVQISNWRGPVRMNRKNEMGGVRVERTQVPEMWRRLNEERGGRR